MVICDKFCSNVVVFIVSFLFNMDLATEFRLVWTFFKVSVSVKSSSSLSCSDPRSSLLSCPQRRLAYIERTKTNSEDEDDE